MKNELEQLSWLIEILRLFRIFVFIYKNAVEIEERKEKKTPVNISKNDEGEEDEEDEEDDDSLFNIKYTPIKLDKHMIIYFPDNFSLNMKYEKIF